MACTSWWRPSVTDCDSCNKDISELFKRYDTERRNTNYFTISWLHHKLSLTPALKLPRSNHVQILCNTSFAIHVQHVCQGVSGDSSAIKFDRAEITLIFYFTGWNHQSMKEGRKLEYLNWLARHQNVYQDVDLTSKYPSRSDMKCP